MKSILLVKTFLGLVEMASRLVNASFSLPEWQAVKMSFFVPSVGALTQEPPVSDFSSYEIVALWEFTYGQFKHTKVSQVTYFRNLCLLEP